MTGFSWSVNSACSASLLRFRLTCLVFPCLITASFFVTPAAALQERSSNADQSDVSEGVNKDALALLKKARATLAGLHTYNAEFSVTGNVGLVIGDTRDHFEGSVMACKPNLLLFDRWPIVEDSASHKFVGDRANSDNRFVCDGKNIWIFEDVFHKTYSREDQPKPEAMVRGVDSFPWQGFFGNSMSPYDQVIDKLKQAGSSDGIKVTVADAGSGTVGTTVCRKVLVKIEGMVGKHVLQNLETFYIGPDTLIRRSSYVISNGTANITSDVVITRLRVNDIKDGNKTLYRFSPPSGTTLSGLPSHG